MEPGARQTIAHREFFLPTSQQADELLFLGICVVDTRSWKLWFFRGGHRQTTRSLSQLLLWPL
eukprot:8947040-Lingulodinium_polyedra.AAC.1